MNRYRLQPCGPQCKAINVVANDGELVLYKDVALARANVRAADGLMESFFRQPGDTSLSSLRETLMMAMELLKQAIVTMEPSPMPEARSCQQCAHRLASLMPGRCRIDGEYHAVSCMQWEPIK